MKGISQYSAPNEHKLILMAEGQSIHLEQEANGEKMCNMSLVQVQHLNSSSGSFWHSPRTFGSSTSN